MSSGAVKWFNNDKGHGFISPHDGSPDLFVPVSQIRETGRGTPARGQDVDYTREDGTRGPEARAVRRLMQGGNGGAGPTPPRG